MANPNKPSKEQLQTDLTSLLVVAHGEIGDAAKKIADTFNELIKKENDKNHQLFVEAVQQAMAVPKSIRFDAADAEVKKAFIHIIEEAKEFLNSGLRNYAEFNDMLKKNQKDLKKRIEKLAEPKQLRR